MINKLKILFTTLIMGMCTTFMCQANDNNSDGKWPLPKSFKSPKMNQIDYMDHLAPFFEKLSAYKQAEAEGNDSLPKPRVLMIGDSHVRGNILPQRVRDRLREVWDIDFDYYCKNGVQLNYFLKEEQMKRILDYKPDLLIVAVGTNEAHSNFNAEKYTSLMHRFVDQVLEGTDSTVTILFTTPPGSHIRGGIKKTKTKAYTSLLPNDTNKDVADCQDQFCKSNGFAIWNLLEIAGGKNAPGNWRSAGLMQRDGIHYTVDAYRLQGDMLAWALVDAKKSLTRKAEDKKAKDRNE